MLKVTLDVAPEPFAFGPVLLIVLLAVLTAVLTGELVLVLRRLREVRR